MLANLAGAQMEPDLAAIVLDSLGITVADLEATGAHPYDLEPLTAINPRHLSKPMQRVLEVVENMADTTNRGDAIKRAG